MTRQRTITEAINIGHHLAIEAIEDDLDDAITEANNSGMNDDFIAGLQHAADIVTNGAYADREAEDDE
jgi:hypothetical protein